MHDDSTAASPTLCPSVKFLFDLKKIKAATLNH